MLMNSFKLQRNDKFEKTCVGKLHSYKNVKFGLTVAYHYANITMYTYIFLYHSYMYRYSMFLIKGEYFVHIFTITYVVGTY